MTTRYGQLANFCMKMTDLGLMLVGLWLAIVINYAPADQSSVPAYAVDFLSSRIKVGNALLGGLLIIIWYITFELQGLYQSHRVRSFVDELKEICRAVFVSLVALLIVAQVGRWKTINLRTTVWIGAIVILLIAGMRVLLRMHLRRLRLRGHNIKKLLLIGNGPRAEWLAKHVAHRTDLGYRLVGYVDEERRQKDRTTFDVSWLGFISDLPRIIENEVIDEVFITLPVKSQYSRIESAITILEEQGIMVHLFSDLFPHKLARSRAWEFEGAPLVSLQSAPSISWRTEAKRVIDFVGSLSLLLLLFPLLLIVAVVIKLDSPGPVFFVQERMGYNKRRFRMIKFRTMTADAEARLKEVEHLNETDGPAFKIRHDPRMTRVGRLLRKLSIDELPQLINVLFGDMSLVGPRPLPMRDVLGLEVAWQKRRFSVKPGLTCLWQVSGRSNLSFEEWMQLDLEYIDRWSLALDCKILLRTIPAIISAEGAV
ncbi:MAG TPA: sugar transferase [Pyrinomonadaceae bacterium]|jgi:exopolysaccharide biosynthesis polyprenyl glycosylphosphotransferase